MDRFHPFHFFYLSLCVCRFDTLYPCFIFQLTFMIRWVHQQFSVSIRIRQNAEEIVWTKENDRLPLFRILTFFAITNFISSDSTLCCFVSVFMKFVLVFIIDSYIRSDRTLTGCYALLSYVEFRLKCDNRAANMRITSDKWCVKWL